MTKPFTAVSFFLFLVFVGYIVLGSTPLGRIERLCEPVSWLGRFVASVTALIHPSGETSVVSGFSQGAASCRFIVWRQIYVEDYQALLRQQALQAQTLQTKSAKQGAAEVPAKAEAEQK